MRAYNQFRAEGSTGRQGVPILITSAISVSARQTVLTDVEKRLELTLAGLRMWLSTAGVTQVVVCDGSGFDLGPHLGSVGPSGGRVDCEVLAFQNDATLVRSRGKGYGEGEIVNHALRHSRILRSASSFAKCTGKLWVTNFASCLRGFNGVAAFDFRGLWKPTLIDSMFYIVGTDFYASRIARLHEAVDDDNGYYLEHAFRDGLRDLPPSRYVMYPTPRIVGMSGSTGEAYGRPPLRALMRDWRSGMVRILGTQ